MTARRAFVGVALAVLAAVGLWWLLRSEEADTIPPASKPTPAAPTATATEKSRESAPSRRAKRVAAADDTAKTSKPESGTLAPTGTLRGVVTDPAGAPAAWATVKATRLEPSEAGSGSARRRSLDVTADTDGHYEMGGVPLGVRLSVVASKPHFVDSVAARDVILDELRPEGTCDLALQSFGRLDVRVLRPDGSPASDAKVRLDSLDSPVDAKSADGAGHVTFDVGASGPLSVCVWASGAARQHVDVEPLIGERRAVDVTLDGGAALAGTVVDERGRPVGRATVRVYRRGRPYGWPDENQAQTRDDGSFRIAGLAPGRYDVGVEKSSIQIPKALADVAVPAADVRVVARLGGNVSIRLRPPAGGASPEEPVIVRVFFDGNLSVPYMHPWKAEISFPCPTGMCRVQVLLNGFAPVERTVDVAPDETTSIPEIVLDPGLAFEGRVVDTQGRPVARANVYSSAMQYSQGRVEVDAAGAFRIEHVAPGAVNVHASAPGFVPTTIAHDLTPDSPPLVVTLFRGGVLRGVVQDKVGHPIGDATADIFDPSNERGDPQAQPYVDSRGVFVARLATGVRRIVVSRNGAVVTKRDVEMREGEETSVEIVVDR